MEWRENRVRQGWAREGARLGERWRAQGRWEHPAIVWKIYLPVFRPWTLLTLVCSRLWNPLWTWGNRRTKWKCSLLLCSQVGITGFFYVWCFFGFSSSVLFSSMLLWLCFLFPRIFTLLISGALLVRLSSLLLNFLPIFRQFHQAVWCCSQESHYQK